MTAVVTIITGQSGQTTMESFVVERVMPPAIAVQRLKGSEILNGCLLPGVDLGTGYSGQPGPICVIQVCNIGEDTLHVSQFDVPSGFAITSPVSGAINAGECGTFTLRLETGTTGSSIGCLSFMTDDPLNPLFEFTVLGEVLASCVADLNGDLMVDVDDLNAILSAWGDQVGIGSPLDLSGMDGVVNVDDLNVVLANWGTGCSTELSQ